jgi:hypothetical protein
MLDTLSNTIINVARDRWDAAENSDESKRDFRHMMAGPQFHGVHSSEINKNDSWLWLHFNITAQ